MQSQVCAVCTVVPREGEQHEITHLVTMGLLLRGHAKGYHSHRDHCHVISK